MKITITPDEAYDILRTRALMVDDDFANSSIHGYVEGLGRELDATRTENARMRNEIADAKRALRVEAEAAEVAAAPGPHRARNGIVEGVREAIEELGELSDRIDKLTAERDAARAETKSVRATWETIQACTRDRAQRAEAELTEARAEIAYLTDALETAHSTICDLTT